MILKFYVEIYEKWRNSVSPTGALLSSSYISMYVRNKWDNKRDDHAASDRDDTNVARGIQVYRGSSKTEKLSRSTNTPTQLNVIKFYELETYCSKMWWNRCLKFKTVEYNPEIKKMFSLNFYYMCYFEVCRKWTHRLNSTHNENIKK